MDTHETCQNHGGFTWMKRPFWLGFLGLFLVLVASAGCDSSALPDVLPDVLPDALPDSPTVVPTPTLKLPPADEVAFEFLQAWERDDYPAMYILLSPASQDAYPEDLFTAIYGQAVAEAAISGITSRVLAAYQPDTRAEVAFVTTFQTALFGDLEIQNEMPLSFVEGRWGIDWSPALVFPQLSDGSYLQLTTRSPSRGNIYDRNGLGLAVQGEMVEVGVVPNQIEDETAVLDQLAAVLGELPSDLQARYANANPDWYIPLGRISAETGQDYYSALNSTPGIELRPAWTRSYRQDSIAPHIVGVVGPIRQEEINLWRAEGYEGDEMVGWMGLERWGEPYLAGERGARLEIVTAQGQQIAVLAEKPPRESSSLYATFDRQFQKQVQDILGQRLGAIVVLEANSGRVLALATYPNFDPNPFATGIDEQQWLDLQSDPRRPLVNRSTQGIYPPGSVFKVVTTAAGLEAGGLTRDSEFLCQGTWTGLGPELPKPCWLSSGHGWIPLDRALTTSCDITFYQVGLLLDGVDPEMLPDYARGFGFGAPTGIQGEEGAGQVPDPAWKRMAKGEGWAPGDAVNLSIGQSELLATPLQVASMMAAVGNGGTLYRPNLVEMIASDPASPAWTFEPVALAQLPVSAEHLAVIQDSLHKVTSVAHGTAYEAFEGFNGSAAGKTGTAESGQAEPHAWFAGYAPAQEPEIAIAVILEHGGTGGEVAAPLFRQVAEAYFAERASD
ncbi:penicillin-binding protein 2 [Chloroflexota bacterium]